jgi:hypothetical protein
MGDLDNLLYLFILMINTIIDKLFSVDNLEKDKNKTASEKTSEKENKKEKNKYTQKLVDDSSSAYTSLYQGSKFIKYQDKIKTDVESKSMANNGGLQTEDKEDKEGFTNNTRKSIIQNLKNEYDKTLNEYNTALSKYNDLAKQTQNSTIEYINRVNSNNNKYLNKIVRFNTGQLYYVTNQGVAKYIPNTDILKSISGKNGCPNTSGSYINITIPWINEYSIEGTQIPTTPPLIVGKNMKANESCGYEGSNVFVNTMLSSKPTPAYVGCYQDNNIAPTMTFIGDSPPANGNTSGTYSINQCQDAAILGGYQYFALQNANTSTGLGYCAVGTDLKTTQKYGNGYAFVPLWSSNTAGKPTTYAVLTKNGTLSVRDRNGTAYYTSPNGTNCNQVYSTSWNIDAPGNDIRYVSGVRRENCEQICNDIPNCGGFAWNRSNDNSCWLKSGKLTNTTGNKKRILIKKTVDTSKCIYFLNLQNDGNMCIYRGTPNTTNITNIWCTYTNGRQQRTNENYTLAKSKYRMPFIKDGQILSIGEWIVSEDGKLLLIMQNDGNLVLYTFKSNCVNGSGSGNSKNIYGGNLANAVYDIGKTGIKTRIGQLGYIDPDSQLYTYPSSNVTYSNTYSSVIQNTNIQGNDIPGAAMNNMSDITKCMNACNKYSDCNAFVYDTTGPYPVCFPKKVSANDLYSPNTFKPSVGKTTYIRDKKPKKSPIGTDNTVHNVDSIAYQNYGNQGGAIQEKYGLASTIPVQTQQLSQIQDKLNLLLSQLNKNLNELKKYNVDMTNNTIKSVVEGFEANKDSTKKISLSNQINRKINNLQKNQTGLDNILRDSKIKTLQQNYEYILWSILALGTVLIAVIPAKV